MDMCIYILSLYCKEMYIYIINPTVKLELSSPTNRDVALPVRPGTPPFLGIRPTISRKISWPSRFRKFPSSRSCVGRFKSWNETLLSTWVERLKGKHAHTHIHIYIYICMYVKNANYEHVCVYIYIHYLFIPVCRYVAYMFGYIYSFTKETTVTGHQAR